MVRRHSVRPHTRKGRPVRGYSRGKGSGTNDSGAQSNSGTLIVIALLFLGGSGVVALGVTGVNALRTKATSHSRASSNTLSTEARTSFKRAEVMLLANGFKASLTMRLENDCAAHSYGRVQKFFRSHPCDALARSYIQIGQPDQGLILVAISWVAMPDATQAADYKRLADTPGAGNITELSREVKLYKNITYTNSAYASGLHGDAAWNVKVKPVFPVSADVVNKILAKSRQ